MSSHVKTLEKLELRRLLAAAVPTWDLLGTDGGDVISIGYRASDQRLLENLNGQIVATRLLRNTGVIAISGLGGNDRISVDLHLAPIIPGLWVNGGPGRDIITGSSGADRLIGGSGRDVIDGGAGDDAILGGTDRDELVGGDGNDYLQGNAGNDTLSGGWGDDTLTGGTGNDQLRGGNGDDDLVGGKNDDTLKGGDDADMLSGGAAANTLFRQINIDNVLSGTLDTIQNDDDLPPLHRLETKQDLKNWIIDRAVAQWKSSFGQPVYPVIQWYIGHPVVAEDTTQLDSVLTASGAFLPQASAPQPVAGDHSDTNTQVAGVDEADIVETDGNYIYLLHDNKLIIADAAPAKDLHIVSTTSFPQDNGYASGIYLDGSRLTVISQTSSYRILEGGGRLLGSMPISYPTKPQIIVTVYDVSDPAAPSVAKTTKIDGWLEDSRLIDGRLYLVEQNYLNAPAPQTIKNDKGDEIYESEASYRARLEANGIDDLIPQYSGSGDVSGDVIAAPDVYVRDGAGSLDVTSVSLLNVRDSSAALIDSTSVVGAAGQIYASTNSLYLAGTEWGFGGNSTQLVKFGLGIDQVTLEASGHVDGIVLNQYSMDEQGQFFRLAVTHGFADSAGSSVYVMDQIGDDLTTIGQIDNIAPGERIYSARFLGDRAYVTTFKQVDPLFSLDLSDPAHPRIAGQLEIPGFSDYLHPVDDNYLIGLGQAAGSDGFFHEEQLSLFNVSDPDHPTRVGTFDFGDNTYSFVNSDFHAFSYFPQQHILALPVSKDGQSLAVLKVDVAKGFSKLGDVEHTSVVQRGVRIGEDLFSIGEDAIRAVVLADPSQVVATLDLPQDSNAGGVIAG